MSDDKKLVWLGAFVDTYEMSLRLIRKNRTFLGGGARGWGRGGGGRGV